MAFPDYTRITKRDGQKRFVAIGPGEKSGGAHILIEMDEGDGTRDRHGLDMLGITLDEEQSRELYVELGRLLGAEEAPLVEVESRQVKATQEGMIAIDVEPSMHGKGVYMFVGERGACQVDLWMTPAEANDLVEAIQWANGIVQDLDSGPQLREAHASMPPPTDEQKESFINELLEGR